MFQEDKTILQKENFSTYIKKTLLKNSKVLKFKYPPISEKVKNDQKILKIEKISTLREEAKDFLLIKARNYDKNPKFRYYLAIILANQSSDLLVLLAKSDKNYKKECKLIQYPIYPQNHRIGLLSLIEIMKIDQISSSFQTLKEFKESFRKKIQNLINS